MPGTRSIRRMRNFYPRPLRGGRHFNATIIKPQYAISIHALCEEGDMVGAGADSMGHISIHALCEEGD